MEHRKERVQPHFWLNHAWVPAILEGSFQVLVPGSSCNLQAKGQLTANTGEFVAIHYICKHSADDTTLRSPAALLRHFGAASEMSEVGVPFEESDRATLDVLGTPWWNANCPATKRLPLMPRVAGGCGLNPL